MIRYAKSEGNVHAILPMKFTQTILKVLRGRFIQNAQMIVFVVFLSVGKKLTPTKQLKVFFLP